MKRTMNWLLATALAAGLFFYDVSTPKAHPHVWIDMQTRLTFDESGRATSLRITWIFDEFYSLYALNKPADEASQEERLALVEEYVAGLESFGYFARVEADSEEIGFSGVIDRDARANGEKLVMTYELELAKAIDPTASGLSYAVFDPTYFIEILHVKQPDAAALGEQAPAGCRTNIVPPNPDPDVVSLAASLGPTESVGDAIGVLFAEWVRVEC